MGKCVKKREFSEEHRRKLSEAHLGQQPWNKGIPMAVETKAKLSKSLSGKKSWCKGKTFTEEHRRKLSDAKLGKPGPWLGKKRHHMSGEKHPLWRGGHPHRLRVARRRKAQKKANGGRHSVFQWEELKKKHNNTCLCCGLKEPAIKLTADHIVPISKNGSDNIQNIQPLCLRCNSRKGNRNTTNFKANQLAFGLILTT